MIFLNQRSQTPVPKDHSVCWSWYTSANTFFIKVTDCPKTFFPKIKITAVWKETTMQTLWCSRTGLRCLLRRLDRGRKVNSSLLEDATVCTAGASEHIKSPWECPVYLRNVSHHSQPVRKPIQEPMRGSEISASPLMLERSGSACQSEFWPQLKH